MTLDCETAVVAAEAVVGPRSDVASIVFGFGLWCPIGAFCVISPPNTGHVVFRLKGLAPDIVVTVTAHKGGKVTASAPLALPSPSAIALHTQVPAPSGAPSVCASALIAGTLVRDPHSGLALQVEGAGVYPVLWPNGYVARSDVGGPITLLDATGNPVAHEGDHISMGGGFVPSPKETWAACDGSITVGP